MKAVDFLCMIGGDEEASYAKNSLLQKTVLELVKPIREQAMIGLCTTTKAKCLSIADLGCSSGPNTFVVASEFITTAHNIYKEHGNESPEFQIYLNDLPMNDFNTVFKSLQKFKEDLVEQIGSDLGPCFVSGMPGSFYGRLFPSRSLNFVHSSYGLSWLSQVPDWVAKNNGTTVYIRKNSPFSVIKAYNDQFRNDFSLFLRSRSEELIPGGRMVLTLIGRESDDPTSQESACYGWGIINLALSDMVAEGLLEEEKLITFNVPFYTPSAKELEIEVSHEGSFTIDELKMSVIKWRSSKKQNPSKSAGSNFADTIRAVLDPLISSHFGKALADEAFLKYRNTFIDLLENEDPCFVNITLSMTRNA